MDAPGHKFTRVYALGSNGRGQLGIGHRDDVNKPTHAMFSCTKGNCVGLHDDSVAKIVGGGNHTLLLTQSGRLYWAGDTKSFTFPLHSQMHNMPSTQIQSSNIYSEYALHFYEFHLHNAIRGVADLDFVPPFHVQNIAATFEASIIVVRDSRGKMRVWSCGEGHKGELGVQAGTKLLTAGKTNDMNDLLPVDDFVPPGEDIVDLAASMSHVVAVLSNGEAWGWGTGRKGQLGAPIQNVIFTPRKIEGVPFPVRRAVCGTVFTCLFGEPRTGDYIVLGPDKYRINAKAPTNESIIGWKDVDASFGHIYVLKSDGLLECWGRNDTLEVPPNGLGPMAYIRAGSEHVVALDLSGKAWAWGWNEHGNCGRSVTGNPLASSTDLSRTPGALITAIGAGWATSWVAVDEPEPCEH